ISYYSVDNVGNVQITQSVTVRLDLIAPTTGIAYTPAYGLNWVNATTTFTITPTDAGSGVKATYYKLDGGSFYISPGSLSVGNFTDGTHTIYYYSVDNAGNTQTMQSAIIQLDKTAPVTTGTYTPAYAPDWVNIATTVTITPSDAGSGVKATYYKLDGGMFYTSPGSFNIGNLTDGSHVISYYSVDNVGNTQSIQQIFLQLDKTSPTSTLSFTPHYGSNYVNSTTIFTISANDFGGSGVGVIYYKTDLIAWTVYSAPFSLNGYPNGTYTIKYYAVDNVGNAESPHQSIVHLDIIGPTIVITSPANQTYGTATINVMLSHADPDYFASWYTITNISNNHVMASNKTWHSPYTSETLTNGAFLIEAWGNDTYGNIKKAASVIFTVDTTAGIPQIQLILPANTTYSNVNLFVEVQNFSRIDTAWFRYFHSGGSWVGNFTLHYNGSYWINNTISLTDDHYQIQVFAERAGHVAQVNKWFTIDTAPPVTTIHVQAAYDNGTKYLNSSSQISFTAIDLSTISVTRFWFDAQVTWQAYLTSFSIGAYNLLNGFHTIYYNSTDIANNNEMTKSTVIYLDTATPGTTISYKAAYAPDWINATTVFTIKPSDLGSGVKATYYKEDSGSYYVAPVSAFALGNLTDGTHMISYYSVDNVGNVQTTQSVTIRLDLLTPTTSIAYTPAYGLNWVNIMTTFTIMPNDADSGVKATYYKLDGGSFYTSPDSFSVGNLTDGTHNIDYFSVDNVGNLQIIQSVIIELDKTAPVTSCTYSPARGTNWVNATTTFTIVPSDAGSGVKITYYQLDSGSFYTSPGSFNIGNLTGGTHTIRYYSMDFVGNVQTIQSFTVRLDKNAPVTVINYTPHHISNFVNASIIFTLSASDYGTGESGVNTTKYRVDSGTWVQYYAAFTLASYVNGTHVIYYFSNDSAGNYEGIKSLSVRLDKNPPVTIINYTRHRVSNFVNATATFTLSATDAGAGESGVNYTFYHIDTQPWVQYSGPFNLSSFGNGTHVIYYYSNDSVGNYEVIKSLSVRLDKNAPVTNISYVQHYILSFVNPSAIFTLSAIDAANGESGVNQTFYMVDSGTWSRYSGSFTLAIYTNGTHAIFYWSNDSAGNYEAIRSLFVRLDRNPPVTRISFTPSQGSNIVNETTIFTMSATDAGAGESGVNQTFYRVDNNPWSQYTGPFTLATLANGTHTIYYYSVDSVGNSEALKSIVVQLGKGPSPSPGPSNNNIELLLIILIAAGAVVVVIAVAIRASKSHSRELVVEPNLTPKQILSRLKHLFVFQRITGSCIVYQPFTQAVFDPQLIAGFLSAITSFGSEIQADAKLRVLEYQSFKILMEETDQCTYALLLEGDLIQQIKDLYHQFIFAFETAYSDDLGKFDGEITPFRSANELIKNIFSVDNLPASNL
ncbi:MAG TPA: hypothetical protein VKM55_10460, partial [Candidatus Lokiarchaeia archaeon]|nr:hypothetical protein [Candidatus Lokiarchaeia archaeon]